MHFLSAATLFHSVALDIALVLLSSIIRSGIGGKIFVAYEEILFWLMAFSFVEEGDILLGWRVTGRRGTERRVVMKPFEKVKNAASTISSIENCILVC